MAYENTYNDERITQIEADHQAAEDEIVATYDGAINESDQYIQDRIDAVHDWEKKQTDLQNEQTDFAIDQINQQKDQANKDYLKEQSGAYADWQKQSNQYGANAEAMAAQGMANGGFSESSQVSMYNTYQNRVATAREAYSRAVLNYDNAIKDARLQNSAALAEIAWNALQQELALALEGFQYKNQLLLDKADKKMQLNSEYYNRYLSVLDQINTENALNENVRQFNESLAFDKEQFEWQKEQANKSSSGGGGSGGGSGGSGGSGQIEKDSEISEETALTAAQAASIIGLGYGPISAVYLDELVKSGQVEEYEVDGQQMWRNTPYSHRMRDLFGGG